MHFQWPEFVVRSWADLELRSSHRHSLDGPRQPLNRQPRCKCTTCALNLLHIPELILHCRTVTTHVWMAPGGLVGCLHNIKQMRSQMRPLSLVVLLPLGALRLAPLQLAKCP